jgi:tryptophan-rich sensory protein
LLAEKYGWGPEQILSMTRPEAIYFLMAPSAYEKWKKRTESRRNKLMRIFSQSK